jgi:hypothetical protein
MLTTMITRIKSVTSYLRKDVNANTIHLVITSLGGFVCLLPLILQKTSYIEHLTIRESLSSLKFRNSCIVTVSLAIPLG